MPTLPLYETSAPPDAWHRVTAPGGYEWWHFDAQDAGGDFRVRIDLFDGDPFSDAYLRAYRRYRRRPTRVPPPVPREHPCLRLVVFELGRPLWRAELRPDAGAFCGSTEHPDIRIASHSMRGDADGARLLTLPALPAGTRGARVSAELAFRPAEPVHPHVRQLGSGEPSATHYRVVASPRYHVAGMLSGTPADGGQPRTVRFDGHGRHEHFYGTGPLGAAAHRWVEQWGEHQAAR